MFGEEYYNKAFNTKGDPNSPEAKTKEYFQKAIAIWERIITELPESGMTPQAYYFVARCYESVGEYDCAANYYQVVIDDWPNYRFCDVAHFLLARCFEKLADSGSIPREEAAVMIRDTCEKLLADYPNSQIVKATNNLLEQWGICKGPIKIKE
jgi:tetratricopeptide (TPR) repeat protein